MQLPAHISELVDLFRRDEWPEARGPRFTAVACAIEEAMSNDTPVSSDLLLECFGPPDLFDDEVWLYRFDHEDASLANDEWYFFVKDGRITDSGFNVVGINDISQMRDQRDFPAN